MPKNAEPRQDDAIRKKGWTYLIMTAVLVAVTVFSIWMIGNTFGDGEVFLSLAFLTVPVVLALCGLLLAYFVFDALRFYFVLRTVGLHVPYLYIVKLSFINVFVSSITPLATGGGFAQIYFLAKKNVPLGSATAASTIRTLLAVVFFLFAAPVAIFMNHSLWDQISGGIAVLIFICVAVYCVVVGALFWIVSRDKHSRGGIYRLLSFLERRRLMTRKRKRRLCLSLFREIKHFNQGVRLYLSGSKLYLSLSVLFTVLFLFTLFSFPVILTRAMDYQIPPVTIYQAQILITFITYFAFTPGAAGIAEGGFAMLFSGLVGKSDITSLTLIWRFFTVYIGALLGMLVFYIELFLIGKRCLPEERIRNANE